MKLFEARGEEAIVLYADLIEPFSKIAKNKELMACLKTKQYVKAIEIGLRSNPKEVLEVLARCDEGCSAAEYNPTALEIPMKLLRILNHPDVGKLFTSQAQTTAVSFGSATENTGDGE